MLFEAVKCVIISPASVCFIIHPAGLNSAPGEGDKWTGKPEMCF